MTPSVSVITQALERSNLSLEYVADFVFGNEAKNLLLL